ncbi:MAG: hypothetical protein Q8L64_01495, partial [bacterium]|nr:hypothetical protein [bacterium]
KKQLNERLAALVYRTWTRWLTQMFSKGFFDIEGRWIMSKEACDEYTTKMTKKYVWLSDEEKAWARAVAEDILIIFYTYKESKNDK